MSTPIPTNAAECVVLFADIADSSELYGRIGDEAAYARVEGCLKAMSRVVAHTGGRVIKLTGDGLMAVFDRADNAIDASMAMSMDLGDQPSAGTHRLQIRIGFQLGAVVDTSDDLFGETVNLSARLCEIAAPGTAVTTAETAAQLSRSHLARLRKIPPRPLKGFSRSFNLFELVCDDITKVTAVFPGLDFAFAPASLCVVFRGETRTIDEGAHRLTIGRDPDCDVVLGGSHASRRHCLLEERSGKFVLIDSSSNGTYVIEQGGRVLRLRREELILSGRGWITFGRPRGEGVEEMEYTCSN